MENQQHQQNQYVEEDEIDLMEYINVIIRRKKLILGIFLAAVGIAVIVNLRMPKVYEVTSTIQLGSLNGPLIKNEDAKAIILNQNALLSVINELNLKTIPDGLQKDIKVSDISGTELLKIQITYPGIDTALKINDAITKPLIAEGQSIYKERTSIISERLKELYEAIKNAEGDIVRTQNLIMNIPSSKDITQAEVSLRMIILQNTLPQYENNLAGLRNQRNDLQIMLFNSRDFKVFDAPIRPKKPVGPKKTQNVILVGILSLMFGVFLAFFMEFLKKCKTKEPKS